MYILCMHLAQFMYQRDSRENPSLDSYMESRSTPRQEEEQMKKSKLTSPLATACNTAKSALPLPASDIGA